MAAGPVISVCAADCNQGLQDRVHGQSSKINGGPVHSDPSKPGKTPGPQTKPRVNAGKMSHQGNPPLNGRSRVLFPDLPGGQGVGRLAPDPQPESVQQIRKAPTLSDGDIMYGDGLLRGSALAEAKDLRTFEGLLNVRDVGSLYRFKRRLFGGTTARSHTVLGKQTRLPRKRRKVSVNTHTVPSLPGIDPRPHQHAHFSEREESRQSVASSVLAPSAEPSAGKDLAEALRTFVQSTRVSPHGGDSHSSYPAYAPQPVDAGLGQPIPPNIPGPRVAQGIGVVGITGQPDGRPPVPQAGSDYDDSYGCLHGGLGRSPRRLGELGPVVVGLGQTPHQLARAPGSMADLAAFPASGAGHCCGCPYGQFHHSGLYQQGG